MRRTGMRAAHRIRKISLLLVSFPLDALAEYIPAGTADEPSLQPGDEARRFQEIDSIVGTPLTRSVNSDFLPWIQSAELHTRVRSSADCIQGRKSLFTDLVKGVPTMLSISWNRRASSPGCKLGSSAVPAGMYSARASSGKLTSNKEIFRIR